MSIQHRRRKQPDHVRQQLLEVAARLSLDKGPAGVTLDAVSKEAGVSKGGLLHHFPNKLALLDGLFDELMGRFDHVIAEALDRDTERHGRFTRAYLSTVFDLQDGADEENWGMLTAALLAEPHLRLRWNGWVADRAAEHAETDGSANCQLVRLAADGLWLADLLKSHDIDMGTRAAIRDVLTDLSRK